MSLVSVKRFADHHWWAAAAKLTIATATHKELARGAIAVGDAEPGAELGVGLRAETTRGALHKAALDGSIVDMIDWRPSKENDFVYNGAGTIHAIGGGLTVVEVQQNVDCTYRLYDYGRPRELHLDEGLKVATPGPMHDPRNTIVDPRENNMLVSGPHFCLAHLAAPVDDALCAAHCQASEQTLDKYQAKVPVLPVHLLPAVQARSVPHPAVLLPPDRVPAASPPARIVFQSLLI